MRAALQRALPFGNFGMNHSMSYSCCIYGLGLEYNVPIGGLKGLPPVDKIDVRLTLGSMPPEIADMGVRAEEYYVSPNLDDFGRPALKVFQLLDGRFFRIEYLDGTTVAIDAAGTEIWATWPEPATVEDTATYLLGPVLGFVLRCRGTTCLHASAVAIGDRAVALVGASGAGKSSMAAAFAQQGYSVLSDDVVALSDVGERFEIQPAYPRVRLWPNSAELLFGSADALPRLTPTWEKRFLELSGPYRFQRSALPLAAIYVIGERADSGPEATVEKISQRAALVELVTNTYTNYLLNPSQRAQEFEILWRLVKQTPTRLLRPGRDFGSIKDTCSKIVDDCTRGLSLSGSNPLLNVSPA